MGRPKLPRDQVRDQNLLVRLTPDEANLLQQAASAAGETSSTWALGVILAAVERVDGGDTRLPPPDTRGSGWEKPEPRSIPWCIAASGAHKRAVKRVARTLSVQQSRWMRAVLLQAARRRLGRRRKR